jgi:hypothetical protein
MGGSSHPFQGKIVNFSCMAGFTNRKIGLSAFIVLLYDEMREIPLFQNP